jgi:hypothetical protein
MKNIDDETMDAALVLGDAICNELQICCAKRGEVIFKVYRKLQELKSPKATADKPNEALVTQHRDAVGEETLQVEKGIRNTDS